jgi:hypothetical protein
MCNKFLPEALVLCFRSQNYPAPTFGLTSEAQVLVPFVHRDELNGSDGLSAGSGSRGGQASQPDTDSRTATGSSRPETWDESSSPVRPLNESD